MGQIVKQTKRGRPAKVDRDRPITRSNNNDLRRSLRRRNVKYVFDLDDYFDEDDIFPADEEQRRRERKLKHLLKIEGGGDTESTPLHASALSDSSDDGGGKPCKKRKIDEDMDEYADDENDEDNYYNYEDDEEFRERKQEPRTQDSRIGTPGELPSGIPLPDKKALELILDKLQKKDIYGVYAEPVDPVELPDYHDVIKHPMDFATVRNKLRHELYVTFEQFENDIFLICSNAMQYNAPDTIYHKQARSIQELARKKFQKIRLNAKHMEEIKDAEQRTRSESNLNKQIKRSASLTVQEPVGSDFSSGATLATAGDVPTQNGTKALKPVETEKLGGHDGLIEGNNNVEKAEESQSGKGSMPRFVRKPSAQDETRRATYSISLSHEDSAESMLSNFEGDAKQLVPVGLYSDHSYARSLARFTASLGSVPWKVASARIEQALPQGFKFGRGWVGEYEPLPTPVLILEDCTVQEPPYLKKVHKPVESWKSRKIPTFLVPSNETAGSVPFFDQRLPFSSSTGFRPPPNISVTTTQPIRGNISETKAPFFLASKPSSSPTSSAQLQNLRGTTFFTEFENKVPKQVELNSRMPFSNAKIEARLEEVASKNINLSKPASFEQPESNGAAFEGARNRKTVGNNVNTTKMTGSASLLAKPVNNYPQRGRALNDPVRLMRNLPEKAQSQQKPSNHSLSEAQVLPSPSSLGINDPNNASVAAARAWMSVGAGGFEPAPENPNLGKNQIYADSLYNSTREMQMQASKFCPAGNVLMDKNSSPVHPFVVSQGGETPVNIMMGNAMAYQNQRVILPQLSPGDLSRLQLQSNWRNISPQMVTPQIISRRKQESRPPDLNISYQSPGKPSSGVLVDSQQPDLALQL